VDLTRAKLDQAAGLMEKHGFDCWIVQFARETGIRTDPLQYLVGPAVTWPSAFLLHKDGRRVAIVGSGDVSEVKADGVWDDVRGYVASAREELLRVLDEWRPNGLGVTWSEDDDTADGITYGMYLVLESLLEGTPYRERLRPAGALAAEVRRRKLPDEIEAIHSAVAATEELFQRIERLLRPGITEKELQQQVQRWVREAGWAFSWEERMDPIVDFGPRDGPMGHSLASDKRLEPGQLIHVDLGIQRNGFASDLQRTWYFHKEGEAETPDAVRKAFTAALAAIDAGMAAIKPGARGYEIDAASRAAIIEAGFPEPAFAFGHHVGRLAHDGGVLGPRWERYGRAPEVAVETGNVFAVEMDLDVPGYGIVGLEEEAVLDEDGAHFLSNPQRELWLLETRAARS
jgi:Xaa-Pro aminopeptidase